VPEVLTEDAGELVPPRDPGALADAIERALAREFDGAELARRAEERYGYDAIAQRWTAVYERLLASRRGSTSSATRRPSDSSV
jgi:glycosyltransferase involved in cell wall biosynthesis